MDGRRTDEFEDAFLKRAERLARLPSSGWAERVKVRLEVAEIDQGEATYLQTPLKQLIGEIAEEGLDIGGWAVLAAQASYLAADQDAAHRFREQLQVIAAYGPLVAAACDQARELLP